MMSVQFNQAAYDNALRQAGFEPDAFAKDRVAQAALEKLWDHVAQEGGTEAEVATKVAVVMGMLVGVSKATAKSHSMDTTDLDRLKS